MKKLLCILLATLCLTGCGKSNEIKLEGDDLTAYNLMLEVCYVATDPSKVSVISGTVTDDKGVFKVSYNNGESTYNVLVYEKDGKFIAERLHDTAASMYKDLLYETEDFDASKVNKALQEKWKN